MWLRFEATRQAPGDSEGADAHHRAVKLPEHLAEVGVEAGPQKWFQPLKTGQLSLLLRVPKGALPSKDPVIA